MRPPETTMSPPPASTVRPRWKASNTKSKAPSSTKWSKGSLASFFIGYGVYQIGEV